MKKSLMNCMTQCAVFFPRETNIILTFILETALDKNNENLHIRNVQLWWELKCSWCTGESHIYCRHCLNQKQTSDPLFLFFLRLHRWLVFVHGFFSSSPSSCSSSIFTCSSTVHESKSIFAQSLRSSARKVFVSAANSV